MNAQCHDANPRLRSTATRIRMGGTCFAAVVFMFMAEAAGADGPLPFPDWPQLLSHSEIGEQNQVHRRSLETELDRQSGSREFGTSVSEPVGSGVQEQAVGTAPTSPGANEAQDNSLPIRQEAVAQSILEVDAEAPDQFPSQLIQPESAPLHPDPVTDSKVRILEVSGLLARQSEISESIIMMERQLRQAELLNKLMGLRGPETPIEIAPGRFETFSDTPAGRRLAYEIEESEITARIRILELRLKEEDLTKALSAPVRAVPVIAAAQSPEELQVPVILRKPTYSLLEILGRNDSYSAIVDVGGKGIMVEAGEALPDGSEVRSISPDGMVIFRDGNIVELRIND